MYHSCCVAFIASGARARTHITYVSSGSDACTP